MENFKPSEVLQNYWELIKENNTFEEFKEALIEEDEDEDNTEIFEAAKKYYENWGCKTLIFIKSLYFDKNHVIDLGNCMIKQFVAMATEEKMFYFFIKEQGND